MTAAIFWLKTRARWKETSVATSWEADPSCRRSGSRKSGASLLIRNMAWTSKTAEPDAWLPSSPTPKRLTWRAFKQSTSDDLVGSAIMPAERIEMLGSPPPI